MNKKSPKADETVSYLINNYTDIKDVVVAVEQMIARTNSDESKSALRQGLKMSFIPLPDQDSFVLRIKLHPSVSLEVTLAED